MIILSKINDKAITLNMTEEDRDDIVSVLANLNSGGNFTFASDDYAMTIKFNIVKGKALRLPLTFLQGLKLRRPKVFGGEF